MGMVNTHMQLTKSLLKEQFYFCCVMTSKATKRWPCKYTVIQAPFSTR